MNVSVGLDEVVAAVGYVCANNVGYVLTTEGSLKQVGSEAEHSAG